MSAQVSKVEPADLSGILPGYGFADAYEMPSEDVSDLLSVARHMLGRSPRWVGHLMKLRNAIVRPLGLKIDTRDLPKDQIHIGLFPVISATESRVILGLDDRHLDFRLVLDRVQSGAHKTLRMSTAVRCRNRFGQIYLALVLPFHRLIVPVMMRAANHMR